MGEPLKLLGAQSKVAAWFLYLDFMTGATKQRVYKFKKSPPVTEQEFMIFFQDLLDIVAELDDIQNTARQGVEVAKDNGLISQTTDHVTAVKEIITALEALVERMESSQ